MLLFSDLRIRLIAAVQTLVQGGLLTERGLARGCGVSQPHIHHILAGKRVLTIGVADRILAYLRISAADLLRDESHPAYPNEDAGALPAHQFDEGGERWRQSGESNARTD